jgi:hypothetical protein
VRLARIIKIVSPGIGIFVASASISFLSTAAATDLDQDCNPRGWVQRFEAWWDPVGFWSAQPAAIRIEVGSRVKAYQVYLVQRQADFALAENEREKARIEQAALAEQLRILGLQIKSISPATQQKLDQALAKAEETLQATYARLDEVQRQAAASAIQWGEKCVVFSREQLAKERH